MVPILGAAILLIGGGAYFSRCDNKPKDGNDSKKGDVKVAQNDAGGTAPPPAPAFELPAPKTEIDDILSKSWEHYKKVMIDKDGRPLSDPDDSDIDGDGDRKERVTVSEAVSYVLLRAVWMNDKAAFDKTWTWAEANLQRKNIAKVYHWNKKQWVDPPKKDHLFAWRYVPSLKGEKGGVIHYDWMGEPVWRGCFEGASDADLDISAALIFAGKRWSDPNYTTKAKNILNDMWNKYIRKVGESYHLFGGDQFRDMGEINPSYLRPSYLQMFASVDPHHPWKQLMRPSYQVIVESGDLTLHDEKGNAIPGKTNLPPNWIDIQPDGTFSDSDIFKPQGGHLFGWDAFRTLFWVAEDYAWFASPTAKRYLTDNTCTPADYGPYCFLKKELQAKGKLNAGYSRDGSSVAASGWWSKNLNKEQFAMYGAYLPYFYFAGDKAATNKIYANLLKMYKPEGYWGDEANDYYGQNWAWFGLALISGKAVNLYPVPASPAGTIIFEPKVPAPSTPAPSEPEETAPETVSPARVGALLVKKIKESSYDFNGGKLSGEGEDLYKFSASKAKDPGFGILTGNTNLKGKKFLRFEIKGNLTKHAGYARFIAQVYSEKDNDSVPSISLDPVALKSNFVTVTVPLKDLIKKVKKVQFLLVTDKGSCKVEVKNLRFE